MKKAFDKGDIDKLYSKMYQVADSLSASETRRYIAKKGIEFSEKMITHLANKNGESHTLRLTKQISNYRNNRLKFHLDYMFRLLELYVKSKTTDDS